MGIKGTLSQQAGCFSRPEGRSAAEVKRQRVSVREPQRQRATWLFCAHLAIDRRDDVAEDRLAAGEQRHRLCPRLRARRPQTYS